jgi:hypothetical protein
VVLVVFAGFEVIARSNMRVVDRGSFTSIDARKELELG